MDSQQQNTVSRIVSAVGGALRWEAKYLHHWIHHFLVAFFLASLCVVFYKLEWLSGLDSLLLQAGQGMVVAQDPEPASDSAAGERDVPLVLTIPEYTYQNVFKRRSPLDRRELADILAAVLAKDPGTLVVDLDISPWLKRADGLGWRRNPAQEGVDRLLKQAGHASAAGGDPVQGGEPGKDRPRVILVSPLPLMPDRGELHETKLQWLKEMCQAGIELGRADVYEQFGVVTRYPPASDYLPPNIGHLAHRPAPGSRDAHGSDGGGRCAEMRLSTLLMPRDMADRLLGGDAGLAANVKQFLGLKKKASPINAKAYKVVEKRQIAYEDGEPTIEGDLQNRVVFLGGAYDSRDKFLVPGFESPMPGVLVHAAEYYSRSGQGRIAVDHVKAYVLEIGVGVALGFIFAVTWRPHHRYSRQGDGGEQIAFLWMLGNIALLAGFITLSVIASEWLLSSNLWISPAPLLIGVFMKNYLAGIRGEEPHEAEKAPVRSFFFGREPASASRKAWSTRVGRFKVAAFIVVWIAAWLFLGAELFKGAH